MRMIPIFIKVHSVDDPAIIYRINSHSIDYYRANLSIDSKTPYTYIKLHGGIYVKVSESVEDIDRLLGVDDDD